MGYKDPDKQRAYQAAYLRKNRAEWIDSHGPCACGSTIDPRVTRKDFDGVDVRIWSLSKERREEVLKNCVVLCRECFRDKLNEHLRLRYTKQRGEARALTAELVWSIRGRLLGRESEREIARYYGIDRSTISAIKNGRLWSWLKGGRRKVYGIRKTKELSP